MSDFRASRSPARASYMRSSIESDVKGMVIFFWFGLLSVVLWFISDMLVSCPGGLVVSEWFSQGR